MTEYLADVTAMSSKGQIVLPKPIRDALALLPGAKLMVLSDGENILLKPIVKPDLAEFRAMMDHAASWAREVGMAEGDILEAVQAARRARGAAG